jgi:glycerol-3-phosphate dehydrogenase
MPIAEAVYQVLHGGLSAPEAARALMERELRPEH